MGPTFFVSTAVRMYSARSRLRSVSLSCCGGLGWVGLGWVLTLVLYDEHVSKMFGQVWKAIAEEGIVPHGGMLASYLLALMRSGEWKLALEVRERYVP